MKQTITLGGNPLTPKPIFNTNVASWCERYVKKHALLDCKFTVLNEQGEFVRHVTFANGLRITTPKGGKRKGAGRKPLPIDWKISYKKVKPTPE